MAQASDDARAGDPPYAVVVNARTQMAVERATGRCLGAFGSNYYRPWVFPLYTPAGYTVVQEFAFDHPFHTGVFVGQNPVIRGERQANFWAMPPRRSADDALFTQVGRIETEEIVATPHASGVRFAATCRWRDAEEHPILDERRRVDLVGLADATLCDMTSEKIAAYGALRYPTTKFGSIGVRVEPRFLPVFGGVVIAAGGRRGTADVVHEQDADFVAYEHEIAGHGRAGICLMILDGERRGPWFVRDYGMALYNPTWRDEIVTPAGASWTIGLRVVAYDGALTEERVARWRAAVAMVAGS